MNKVLKNLIKLFIGLIILFAVFYKIGFSEILGTLISVNLWVLPLIVLFQTIFVFIGALDAWILLKPISKISYFEFLKCYVPAWSIGLFVPGKFGEASIIYFLKKKGVSVGQGTAVFVIEKLITLIVLGLTASFGFFIFFSYQIAMKLFGFLIAAAILGFIILFSNFSRNLIRRIFLRKYQKMFTGFSRTTFGYLNNNKSLLFFSFIFNFLRWIVGSYVWYLIFLLGFNVYIEFYKILMISAIGTIVGLIPISMNGLGIRQGTSIYLYGLMGIPSQTVASMQIIGLVLIYIMGILGVWWWRK